MHHNASFNPSRGIAIIQTSWGSQRGSSPTSFQSLTRDSNHSNQHSPRVRRYKCGFNPSRGIAIIQTGRRRGMLRCWLGFNPSRGIAIIQTQRRLRNGPMNACFNPSRGIAIIQTCLIATMPSCLAKFQSLTRDSNHSNPAHSVVLCG